MSIMAVGQLLPNINVLSGVPSPIYARLLPQSKSTLQQSMQVQNGERYCSNWTYYINSASKKEVLILATRNDYDDEYLESLWEEHAQWQDNVERVIMTI